MESLLIRVVFLSGMVKIFPTVVICLFKWVNSKVCELYLNKDVNEEVR